MRRVPGDVRKGDAMTDRSDGRPPQPGRWPLVILAWLAVGVPLLWGVWMTLRKAALLFK